MRKQIKPVNTFLTKPHSYSPSVLKNLQIDIFQNEKILEQLELLEILAKETRLQILFLLKMRNFICVGDLSDTLRLDISAVSHQLRLLKRAKLVLAKKKGKVVYYNLNADLPRLVKLILYPAQN